jgi:hypothetical protein
MMTGLTQLVNRGSFSIDHTIVSLRRLIRVRAKPKIARSLFKLGFVNI